MCVEACDAAAMMFAGDKSAYEDASEETESRNADSVAAYARQGA
jgi:hypothetical protein